MAALAESFSESDDELLQKQAAVLDDILITLGSPKNSGLFMIAEAGERIEELKKKYRDTREKQMKWNNVKESIKDIEKAPVYKHYRNNEAPQSARTCINHPGAQLQRVGENKVRCELGGEELDWSAGFETIHGNKVPGSDVSNQSSFDGGVHEFNSLDDTRVTRMQFGQ